MVAISSSEEVENTPRPTHAADNWIGGHNSGTRPGTDGRAGDSSRPHYIWVLLAAFVVLIEIAQSEASTETVSGSKSLPAKIPSRQSRRNGLSQHVRRNYCWPRIGIWLVVVLSFATAVGLLTWFKTIHHQLAAREMSQDQDYKSQGDIPAGVRKFERAIGRAPDVPTYYSFLANVYLAYAGKIHNDLVPREAECDLQSQGNDAAYIECLDRKAFDIKPRAVERRSLYVRTQMNLADAALELALDNPEAYPPKVAILHKHNSPQSSEGRPLRSRPGSCSRLMSMTLAPLSAAQTMPAATAE